jgi:hypothetical protein
MITLEKVISEMKAESIGQVIGGKKTITSEGEWEDSDGTVWNRQYWTDDHDQSGNVTTGYDDIFVSSRSSNGENPDGGAPDDTRDRDGNEGTYFPWY